MHACTHAGKPQERMMDRGSIMRMDRGYGLVEFTSFLPFYVMMSSRYVARLATMGHPTASVKNKTYSLLDTYEYHNIRQDISTTSYQMHVI